MLPTNWWKIFAESSTQYTCKKHVAEEDEWVFFRCVILVILMIISSPLMAKDSLYNEIVQFDIPQQQADMSLIKFAEQANITLIVPFDEVKEITVNRLVGRYPIKEALKILLSGTGLEATVGNSLRIAIVTNDEQGNIMQKKKPSTIMRAVSALLLLISGASGSDAALAADTEPQSSNEAGNYPLEEVIVTANRREQSINDVGMAIIAMGADTLDKQGIDNLESLAGNVPGLDIYLGNGSNNPTITLRGVGTTIPWVNNNQSVATYVDGAYLPFSSYLTQPMFDLARVEVLKGPQIALYGRNATAGAINFISAKPTEETEGYLDLTYGNYDKKEVIGAVSGAVSDAVQLRLAGIYTKGGGYMNRPGTIGSTAGFSRVPGLIPGVESVEAEDDYGDKDVFVLRGSATIDFTDTIDAFLTYHYGRDKSELLGSTNTNGDRIRIFMPPNDDPFVDYDDTKPQTDAKQHGGVFRLNVDVGDYTLSSITSVENLNRSYSIGDGVPSRMAEASFTEKVDTFNQEVLLKYQGEGRSHWMIGATYTNDEIDYARDLVLTDFLMGSSRTVFIEKDKSYAVFGQGDWELSDEWLLTIGMRYTDEEKKFDGGSYDVDPYGTSIIGLVWPPLASPGIWGSPEYSEDDFSANVGLNWEYSDNGLIYLSVSNGFKSGGFDGSGADDESSFLPFDSEDIMAYELGIKTTFEELNTFVAVSAFYYDYTDKQVVALVPFGGEGADGEAINVAIIQNAASSEVYGLDFELNAALTDKLVLSLNGTFLETEVTDWDSADPQEISDRIGNELPGSPSMSMTGKLQWSIPIIHGMDLDALVWATYSEGAFRDIKNDAALKTDSRTVVNARLDFAPAEQGRGLTYYAYVNNLFDSEYITSVRMLGGMEGLNYGPPRQFGVGLKYNF